MSSEPRVMTVRLESDGSTEKAELGILSHFLVDVFERGNTVKISDESRGFKVRILTFQEVVVKKSYEELEKEVEELKKLNQILQFGTPKPTAPPNREVQDDPRHRSTAKDWDA